MDEHRTSAGAWKHGRRDQKYWFAIVVYLNWRRRRSLSYYWEIILAIKESVRVTRKDYILNHEGIVELIGTGDDRIVYVQKKDAAMFL